jgi:hypothetical protein
MKARLARKTGSAKSSIPLRRVKPAVGADKQRRVDKPEPGQIELSDVEIKTLRNQYFSGPVSQFRTAKQNLVEMSSIDDVIVALRITKKAIIDYANYRIRDVLAEKIGITFVRSPNGFDEDFVHKPNMQRLELALDGALFNLVQIENEFHHNDGFVTTTKLVMFLQIAFRLVDFVDREILEFEALQEAGLSASDSIKNHPRTIDYIMQRFTTNKKLGEAKK